MHIISGKYKGRTIYIPKGVKIRPTTDKVREALFDILKNRISGASFLDLYCGSGACGIEAISNGAGDVYFVDSNSRCIETVKRNLEGLHISAINVFKSSKKIFFDADIRGLHTDLRRFIFGNIREHPRAPLDIISYLTGRAICENPRSELAFQGFLFKMDAIESIRFFKKRGLQFDIIFLDPPYYRGFIRNTLLALGSYDILTQSGLIIAESFKKDFIPEETQIFSLFRQKRYGDTVLSFYERPQKHAESNAEKRGISSEAMD